jgi:transcriptional regulator with XRE-family HTH domain
MSGKMDRKTLVMSKILSIFASSKQSSIIYMGIHIGKIIEEELKRQGMTVLQFAEKIITSRTNVYNIFKAKYIPLNRLEIYSKALNKNLVQIIADKMEEELGRTPNITNEEYLNTISGKRMEYVRKYPDYDGKELEQTKQEREQLKQVLEEYFGKTHTKALLIVERGYTFGALEVVRQVAAKTFGSKGHTVCPSVLNNVALKSYPQKVLTDYICKNCYMSAEAIEHRLSDIYQAQQDVNKHFVCILPVEKEYPVDINFKTWDEQFFIVEYIWNRQSLLSWATDSHLHPKVIEYIRYHKPMSCMPSDYGVPSDYPVLSAFTQRHFEDASRRLEWMKPDEDYRGSYSFEKKILNFDKDTQFDDYKPLPLTRSMYIGISVDGYYWDQSVYLSADDMATLVYLYDYAVNGPLKDLDHDTFDTEFYTWLKENHPKLANAIKEDLEDSLVETITYCDGPPGLSWDLREHLNCSLPATPEECWYLYDNDYTFYMADLPERIE